MDDSRKNAENSVRSYLSDLRLPKDVMKMLLQGAQKSKDEITKIVGREIVDLLERVDWSREVERFLKANRIRVKLEFDIEPRNEDEPNPNPGLEKEQSSSE